MRALVIVEHDNKNLKPLTLNTITAASEVCKEVDAIVIGSTAVVKGDILFSEISILSSELLALSFFFSKLLNEFF